MEFDSASDQVCFSSKEYSREEFYSLIDSTGGAKIKPFRETFFSSDTENIHNNVVQHFLYNPLSQVHLLSFFGKGDLTFYISAG